MAGVARQQRLQGVQVIALHDEVARIRWAAGKPRDRLQQSERDVFVMLDDGFFADPVQGWHGKSSNPSAWASHPRRTFVPRSGFVEIEIVLLFFLDIAREALF